MRERSSAAQVRRDVTLVPMNFRVWASVRSAGEGRFFVTVSAASDGDPDRTGGVETGEATSLADANALRDRLIAQMEAKLRARGHNVIETKLE